MGKLLNLSDAQFLHLQNGMIIVPSSVTCQERAMMHCQKGTQPGLQPLVRVREMSYCYCMTCRPSPDAPGTASVWRSCCWRLQEGQPAESTRSWQEVCPSDTREGGGQSGGPPAPHSCLSCPQVSQSHPSTPCKSKGNGRWMGRNSSGDLTLRCSIFPLQFRCLVSHLTHDW